MSDIPVELVSSVPGLVTSKGYSYAASSPGELVWFAGQVSLDAEGKLVGRGDFDAQMRQTFANLRLALAAAGCTPASVLRVSYFVVGLTPDRLVILRRHRDEFFGEPKPAATLLGVSALFDPDALIEIEVVAARAR